MRTHKFWVFFFYKNVILLIFNENENSKNLYSFSIFKLIFLDAKMKSEYKRQGQTSILVMDPKKTKNENKIHNFFLLTKKPRFSHFWAIICCITYQVLNICFFFFFKKNHVKKCRSTEPNSFIIRIRQLVLL